MLVGLEAFELPFRSSPASHQAWACYPLGSKELLNYLSSKPVLLKARAWAHHVGALV